MIVDVQAGDTLFSIANDVGASWQNSVVLKGLSAYPMIFGQNILPSGDIHSGDKVFLGASSPIIVDSPTKTLYSIGVANSMKWQHLKVFRPANVTIDMRGSGYMPSGGNLFDGGQLDGLKLGDHIYVPYEVGCNCGEESTSPVSDAEQTANTKASGQDVEAVSQECNQKRVIVIDPGHGGTKTTEDKTSSWNNAKSVSGELEKNLTLTFAKILKQKLESDSVKKMADNKGYCNLSVFLTRETDINLTAGARRNVAANNSADIFVSLHFNGFYKASARGIETFYRSPEGSAQSNANEDKQLANIVQSSLFDAMKNINPNAKNRGVKHDREGQHRGISVLRDPGKGLSGKMCRSILIETEFITNPDADRLLVSGPDARKNTEYLMEKLAEALVMGL